MAVPAAAVPAEQLIAFRLAGECYAVPIARVHEIIRLCAITRVPRAPRNVRGVVNLRGRIVPVVDLRSRLGMAEAEATDRSRIIVVESCHGIVGLVVDSVCEVVRIPVDQLLPPPVLVAGEQADLVRGLCHLEGNLIILLDLDRVLQV